MRYQSDFTSTRTRCRPPAFYPNAHRAKALDLFSRVRRSCTLPVRTVAPSAEDLHHLSLDSSAIDSIHPTSRPLETAVPRCKGLAIAECVSKPIIRQFEESTGTFSAASVDQTRSAPVSRTCGISNCID